MDSGAKLFFIRLGFEAILLVDTGGSTTVGRSGTTICRFQITWPSNSAMLRWCVVPGLVGTGQPETWSVARAVMGVNVFAALVGPFDYLYKTNYFYLRSKPANPSLLDFLGPWPIYIVGTEAVA